MDKRTLNKLEKDTAFQLFPGHYNVWLVVGPDPADQTKVIGELCCEHLQSTPSASGFSGDRIVWVLSKNEFDSHRGHRGFRTQAGDKTKSERG